jgi:hypothetical protein
MLKKQTFDVEADIDETAKCVNVFLFYRQTDQFIFPVIKIAEEGEGVELFNQLTHSSYGIEFVSR